MSGEFNCTEFRLIRSLQELSLEDIANKVGKTKQYISNIENGRAIPTDALLSDLASVLGVTIDFLTSPSKGMLTETQIHFRKKTTTPKYLKEFASSCGVLTNRLVMLLDSKVRFPKVNIPELSALSPDLNVQIHDLFDKSYTRQSHLSNADIDNIADKCRDTWGIGMGPISNMTRLAEHIGVIVTVIKFPEDSDKLDALSFYNSKRPIIVRNDAKDNICRQRFDIAHELGHLVLHQGVETGDSLTEGQANYFAGALLLPRSIMLSFFPRVQQFDSKMNWKKIEDFKKIWRVSQLAIFYRAHNLGLLSDSQFKSAVITLKTNGQAIKEHWDDELRNENEESPELLKAAFNVLATTKKAIYAEEIAEELKIRDVGLLTKFIKEDLLIRKPEKIKLSIVRTSL
ncbi:putative Zn peptidase [Beggiatoa alba B18LD]|uniref:Putative Zn peptidase n=1 Tax=Beggiatoa alba B18LD TaxID=395493 RepID=I3CE22_9GAMM|nr:XRE family transcriptional regulator [Beggiatoa alba]EIJ41865.1 putative Zn peptidase [Beggiatoa alba B18LD]